MSSTQVRSEIEADEFEDDADEEEEVRDRTYRFRMRHVFYIHLAVFVAIGLLGGLVVYLVENYSSSRNQHMPVSYVNAWFLSCTCAYGCGLTTVNFAQLSKASQIILLLITLFSGFTVSTLPVLAKIVFDYILLNHHHLSTLLFDRGHRIQSEWVGTVLRRHGSLRQRRVREYIRHDGTYRLERIALPTFRSALRGDHFDLAHSRSAQSVLGTVRLRHSVSHLLLPERQCAFCRLSNHRHQSFGHGDLARLSDSHGHETSDALCAEQITFFQRNV